jgi:alpha-N-acetylglucosamine transferase
MHLIMAFLASIGKIFGDGGLQNILTSSDVYAAALVNQMLQGKQYDHAIRGVRLAHEALSQMLLTSAEAFAIKNSLPWLTNETKLLVRDLEQSCDQKMQLPVLLLARELRTQFPRLHWIRSTLRNICILG